MSEFERLTESERALAQAEEKFTRTKKAKEKLKQRRSDGKLLYDNWRGTADWKEWREQQLERQNWQCAWCSKQMKFGEKVHLANGDFALEPQHPTIDHVLPKSFFPELALEKSNLVMICYLCNKKKSNKMAIASQMRHRALVKRIDLSQ